ncbi:four-carbon acid sugar kinase family protein [Rhizobium cremeum]|uniref:four-carbon acid sugar kinase family protein n=1 Tax=Rhizobium cremeum TaxID=2813827 RepID=UPI000DE2A42D
MPSFKPVGAPKLCIIADDLTGALDSAAPFAGRGMQTAVAFEPEAVDEALATGAEIIAVSTRSREVASEKAVAAVGAVLKQLPKGTRLFKKIDSRLKGHVAEELAALNPALMLVAPAIPKFRRNVRLGMVTGFGVAEPIAIRPRLGALADRAVIPDTDSLDDLRQALQTAPDALPVGARGLAEAMAEMMTGRREAAAPKPSGNRVVFVVGSRDPITLAQVDALKRKREVLCYDAPNGILSETGGSAGLTLVQALPGETELSGADVSMNLARGIHPDLTSGCDLLFMTGGATAEAILAHMGIRSATLLGECLPGLPLARAGHLTIIAKSGGFGDKNTLAVLAELTAKRAA